MTHSDGLPTPRRYLAILAISCGTAVAVIDSAIVTVALPTIARDLHVPSSSAVLLVSVYQLVLVMSLLPFSAIGDRIGHRRLFAYGLCAFLLSTVLCFFTRSLPFLLVVRAIQALGGAAALSVNGAMLRGAYPASQLGRGLGINGVVVAASAAIAPTIGGIVLGFASWPWLFVFAVPFALLALLLGHRTLPATPPVKAPYDVLGALLCALTFGLTIAGTESLVHGDSPMVSLAIVTAGLIIGTRFVRRELDARLPILPVDLLKHRIVALSVLGATAAFCASMTLLLSMPFRLQQVYGFTPTQVGVVIAPWPLAMMFSAPFAGALSDRVPAWILGCIGMAFSLVAALLIAELPAAPTQLDIVWRMMLCGIGYGFFFASNARVIVGSAPRDRAASAGAMIATTRLTGQTLGATVFATLLHLNLGLNSTPALVAAVLALVAGICSLSRINSGPVPSPR
jgi:DHA2 family multidrug resistance protein-like MFS transporter